MARRVYVVGAYVPNGGTIMAYEVGRLIHERFGYEGVSVASGEHGPDNGIFRYRHRFPNISIAQLLDEATADDLLLCNPSFSDNALGLRFPGRKIMYVQDFRTYAALDLYFDLYVSVSGTVQSYLRRYYGLRTVVIPAFCAMPDAAPLPWRERPENVVLTNIKGKDLLSRGIGERVADVLRETRPDVELRPLYDGTKVPHGTILERLGAVRTLLSLVPAEGFGLAPLEAMGVGTTVCGLDGIGGREYMRPGRNCLVTSYGPIAAIARTLLDALDHPGRAEAIAARGFRTAQGFALPLYEAKWTRVLQRFLA